jgi:hypothetical protein
MANADHTNKNLIMAVLHARSVISGSFSVASTSLSVTAESRVHVFLSKKD